MGVTPERATYSMSTESLCARDTHDAAKATQSRGSDFPGCPSRRFMTQRGREEVTRVDEQDLGPLSLQLRTQGAQPVESPGAISQAAHAVGVVKTEDHEGPHGRSGDLAGCGGLRPAGASQAGQKTDSQDKGEANRGKHGVARSGSFGE